jgi:hypothetical protein
VKERDMADGHQPTQKMVANAKKGLDLREAFGRGGTEVGVKRAQQIIDGGPLTDTDVQAMYSYFARHEIDKQGKAHEWGDDKDPSAGYIAWLLWGGEEGRDWADRNHAKIAD